MVTFVNINKQLENMIKLLLAIITLGYTSHKEISNFLFGGKKLTPKEF